MTAKRPRQHDKKHLDFIRSLPCCVCHNNIETQAAHIRYSDARFGKTNPGSHKPDDKYTLPLCNLHHQEQHAIGDERKFWDGIGLDPIPLALELYAISGDNEKGCKIIQRAGQPVNSLAAG